MIGPRFRAMSAACYFGRHPEKVIAFFDKHMKSSARAIREEATAEGRVWCEDAHRHT